MTTPAAAPRLSIEGLHDYLRLTGLAFETGSTLGLTFGTSDPYQAGLVVMDILQARRMLAQVSGSQNR